MEGVEVHHASSLKREKHQQGLKTQKCCEQFEQGVTFAVSYNTKTR